MEKKIQKWLEEGIIDKENALRLLAKIKEDTKKRQKLQGIVAMYTVGAICIGFAIISFIAANDWILKLFELIGAFKIILLLLASILFLKFGYKFAIETKSRPRLGKSLAIVSAFLIGGTYSFAGQYFDIEAGVVPIFSIWFISVLPLAYLFSDKALNIMSIILFIITMNCLQGENIFDSVLFIPILTGCLLYTAGNVPIIKEKFNSFSLTYKIFGLFYVYFTLLALTFSTMSSYNSADLTHVLTLIGLIIINVIIYIKEKNKDELFKTETLFFSTILALLYFVILFENLYTVLIMLISHFLIIVMIISGFKWGYKFKKQSLVNQATFFLTVYVISTYCKFGWTYLNKTLFFLIAGVILIGLGYITEKKRKEVFGAKTNEK